MEFYPNRLIIVVGPTASGKSEFAVKLAKKSNGEIISCDSRQIYRGFDIGTGKVAGKWKAISFSRYPESAHLHDESYYAQRGSLPPKQARPGSHRSGQAYSSGTPLHPLSRYQNSRRNIRQYFVYKNIIHHCIDFVDARRHYSVTRFKQAAQKAIREITARGRVPVLCGGTGHWIDAVVFQQTIPPVKPNAKLRKQLEKNSDHDLFEQLTKLDAVRAAGIDKHNKRRLIRALEIVITTGKPVPVEPRISNPELAVFPPDHNFQTLWIGLNPGQEVLYKKIDQRLYERLEGGMIQEVENLHHQQKLSWERLESFGLEYKYIASYLQKKLSYEQMVTQLSFAIKHYAKRQMTWFKRNTQIQWIIAPDQITQLVDSQLK